MASSAGGVLVERSLLCLEDELTQLDDDVDDAGRRSCRRALHCRTLLTDDRVLGNLLATERHRRPSDDCFCRQPDLLPYMRNTVVTWMLEVLCCISLILSATSVL